MILNIDHDIQPVFVKGLVSDYAKQNDVNFLIRGIRSHADLDAEILMALMNRKFSGIETVMLMAKEVSHQDEIIREKYTSAPA